MSQSNDDMRLFLETLDVESARRLWRQVSPHLPQPESEEDALIVLHYARTNSSSIAFKMRAYSHRWLTERNIPSGLPDYLRPSAERLYPRVVDGVGISVLSTNEIMRPVAKMVRGAMEDVVMDSYANGDTEPKLVKGRMLEAREIAKMKLSDLIQEALAESRRQRRS